MLKGALQERHVAQSQQDEGHAGHPRQQEAVGEEPHPEEGFPFGAQGHGVARRRKDDAAVAHGGGRA